jgi:hypothetical protein
MRRVETTRKGFEAAEFDEEGVQPIVVRDDCLIFSTLSNRTNCNCSQRRKAPSFHTLE